jgi:hypothetical protein
MGPNYLHLAYFSPILPDLKENNFSQDSNLLHRGSGFV